MFHRKTDLFLHGSFLVFFIDFKQLLLTYPQIHQPGLAYGGCDQQQNTSLDYDIVWRWLNRMKIERKSQHLQRDWT